ncbi:MAG: hypothetical protein B5766_02875 [Candidatus Lumbricidophila eiseniae]|uniref:YcaO domain-containing protein n=1 Tax=Candidatus Lumbricidiphila eiseniae TaxID=1969409 RepID=A0A2A6FT76_9MICO|nr:MAG: hypothetical protein B5766_02875 [Candidatus Lumbricidophila eiseniae]
MTATLVSDTDFDRVRSLLRTLVSPRVGILRRTLLLPTTGGQIPCAHFTAAVSKYDALPTGGVIANPGASSWDPRHAVTQVTFEAIERYCAAFVDYGALARSKPEGPAFKAGMQIQRFADEQYTSPGFPFTPITAESDIHWTTGRSLLTGDRRFIPAVLTYLPYLPSSPAEVVGPSFSTGMAASWSRDAACLNGLLELIERDAFMLKWMNHASGDVLVPGDGTSLAEHVETVERDGRTRVTFTDMTSDIGIPVVCCLLERTLFGCRIMNIGLSCKLDYAVACEKALCEAISDYERIRVSLEDGTADDWEPGDDFINVTDFEWHGFLYSREEYQDALKPLRGNGNIREIKTLPDLRTASEHLNEVLLLVKPHVSDVLAVDLTTRDMEALGVCVVKVFAPELVPLNADHRYPYLGHARLKSAINEKSTFNTHPHPFS